MKKLITITTLLAAGTLCASAAIETEILWGFDFTSETLGLSENSTQTGTVSGRGIIDVDGGLFGTGTYTTGNADQKLTLTASGDTSALKEGSGAFTISFHAKYISGTSSWPVLAAFGVSSDYQYKLNYYINDGAIKIDKDGYAEMTGAGSDGKTLATTTPSGDWAHYALVFGGESGAKTLSLYIDGALMGTGTLNLRSGNPMTNFSFGGKLNSKNESALTLSDIAIYKGALETDQILYLSTHKANAGAIPEPSAFGLLAGLGALALAGTRRRRRK